LTGTGPQPVIGRERLKTIPHNTFPGTTDRGKVRHLIGNLHCTYGSTRDIVIARYYNLVSNWAQGGSLVVMAICEATLVRIGAGWQIKRNDLTLLH
jgi:hypothetical protein